MKVMKMTSFRAVSKLYLLVAVAMCACAASAVVTLTESTTVTELDPEGYTSDTDLTLTVNLANDVTYSGVVAGRVAVVKKGAGRLTLTEKWTQPRTTRVEEGVIQAPDSSYFVGSGGNVTLKGGGVALTTGTAWARTFIVSSGSEGTLEVASGQSMSLPFNNHLTMSNATLRLTGPGIVYGTGRPPAARMKDGTIIVESGTFRNGNVLLGAPNGALFDMAVDLREGTAMDVQADRCMVLPRQTTLCGVTVAHTGSGNLGTNLVHVATKTFDDITLGELVTVRPSATPSVIKGFSVALASLTSETVFDVQVGATLEIDARLNPGLASAASYRTGQGFVKCGGGELILKGPVGVDGTIMVVAGTLTLSQKAYASLSATLDVRPGATVRLENGTVLASGLAPQVVDPLLSQAEVWMDATRIVAQNGASISAFPNLGTCGGVFRRFPKLPEGTSAKAIPAAPTYNASGINGLPVLNFNGAQALNLTSYTNNGNGLTVFCVYKWNSYSDTECCGNSCAPFSMQPIMPGRHEYDSVSLDASGNLVHNNHGGMVGGLYHGYSVVSEGAPAKFLAQTGTQRYTLDWSGKVTDRLGTLVTVHVRSGDKNKGWVFYGNGSDDFVSGTGSPVAYNQNIQNISLGSRLYVDGAAMCDRNDAPPPYTVKTTNRLFLGQIGEYIVFSRGLSDAERIYVETYLRRKWLGVSDAMPTLSDVSPVAATNLVVSVPASARAVLATDGSGMATASGLLLKTGAGELAYAGTNAAADAVEVATGTLELAPFKSLAAIWVDPSDASTVTLETGSDNVTRVTELRNKGSAGGSFTRNPNTNSGFSAFCPPYNASGINGRATLSFDRFSALATGAYTNWNESVHQQFVYAVLQRNEYSAVYTSGPFAFGYRATTGTDTGTDYGIRWVESSGDSTRADVVFRNNSAGNTLWTNYTSDDGEPFIASVQQADPIYLFAMWNPATGAHNLVQGEFAGLAPMRVDWVQLGGRLYTGGAAWTSAATINNSNRMWKGEVGEFIVFDRQLSQADEAELIAYLEKKWFNVGSGSATPPMFLTGRPAPSFRNGTALTVDAGTTLASSGPSVELAALTFGNGATVARRGGDALKIADVTGALAFGGSATLETTILPEEVTTLFTYGSLVPPSSWTVPERYAVVNETSASALNLLHVNKLIIIFR